MPNAFDPYREALVVEQHTEWPEEYEDWSAADKAKAASLLHANPTEAADLELRGLAVDVLLLLQKPLLLLHQLLLEQHLWADLQSSGCGSSSSSSSRNGCPHTFFIFLL
jgi:hypothetical protein